MDLKTILKNKSRLIMESGSKKVNAYPIVTVTFADTFKFDYDMDEDDIIKVVEVTLPCDKVDTNDIEFSDEYMQKFLKDKTAFTVDSKIKGLAIENFKKEKSLIDPEKFDQSKLTFRITGIGYEPFEAEEKK